MAKIVSLEKINELYKQYPENIVYTLKVYQALLDLDKVETYECNLPDEKMSLQCNKYGCFIRVWQRRGNDWGLVLKHINVKSILEFSVKVAQLKENNYDTK